MPKRNRQTLKQCFREGSRPTRLDFENLIDSTVNILDDGLSKDPDTGIALIPAQGRSTVMTVFRSPGEENAAWKVALDRETGSLVIGCAGRSMLTPGRDGQVEVSDGEGVVKVEGTLLASARKGIFTQEGIPADVPADGHWHDITGELEGCWALEVVAGCGRRNTGKHALLVATAVHCFGARPRIKKVSSHYGIRGHRIRLRWKRKEFACVLQVRSSFNYGEEIRIRFHITRLWDEHYMEIL